MSWAKKIAQRKSNKNTSESQRYLRLEGEKLLADERERACELLAAEVLDQFSERAAQCGDFRDVVGREIRPRGGRADAFAADLDYADYFFVAENRRANNFLNCFGAERFGFHAFEDACMARLVKMVVHFGAFLTRGAGGERGWTRKRNKTDVFQCLRNEKIKMTPLCGDSEDGHFFCLYVESFRYALSNGRQGNLLLARLLGA